MKRLRWLGGRERGVTLIELLVAIPIAGLIAAAAAGTIVQLLHTNNISAGMLAVRQVQTAGDWVSRDGVQAQSVNIITGSGPGMSFKLKWSYWDTGASPPINESHEVTYSLKDMTPGSLLKQLQRRELVQDKNGATISDTTITVGEYIDSSATTCGWLWETVPAPAHYSSTTFTFALKVVVGGRTESRSYQVRPRAMA